jgi:hypothetical protein
MAKDYTIQRSGAEIQATINNYRTDGDAVTLKRVGNDVSATYLPPAGLTSGLPATPELLPLSEVRDLIEKYPEIAVANGFALAIELSIYDAEQARASARQPQSDGLDALFAMMAGLKGADGRLDPDAVNNFADTAKAMGLYK